MKGREQKPRARTKGLLIEELDGETLVYDLDTHEAHCLNPTAALLWKGSDGDTSVAELSDRLGAHGLPQDDAVVWMALDRLGKARLLEDGLDFPGAAAGITRKEVLRVLGAAAGMTLLLPAIDSISAPLAAQAASCLTFSQCRALRAPTCTGLPICTNRRFCCKSIGFRGRTFCFPRRC